MVDILCQLEKFKIGVGFKIPSAPRYSIYIHICLLSQVVFPSLIKHLSVLPTQFDGGDP